MTRRPIPTPPAISHALTSRIRKYMPKDDEGEQTVRDEGAEPDTSTTWLIDTENEASRHACSYADIASGDDVWWLWTYANKTMPLSAMRACTKAGVTVHVSHARKGQNALDFQIVTLLGNLVAQGERSHRYVIVTNDEGFDAAVAFWRARGYDVSRRPSQDQGKHDDHVADFCLTMSEKATPEALMRIETAPSDDDDEDEGTDTDANAATRPRANRPPRTRAKR